MEELQGGIPSGLDVPAWTTEAAQQVCRDVCWKLFAFVPTGKEQSGWRDRLRTGAKNGRIFLPSIERRKKAQLTSE